MGPCPRRIALAFAFHPCCASPASDSDFENLSICLDNAVTPHCPLKLLTWTRSAHRLPRPREKSHRPAIREDRVALVRPWQTLLGSSG